MSRRKGEMLVEVLIALVIIIIAISISVIASASIVNLKKTARIKSDIYDIVYSRAEEQLSTSTILPDSSITKDSITYTIKTIDSTIAFFDSSVTSATLTVYPNDFKDDYSISIVVFPKQ